MNGKTAKVTRIIFYISFLPSIAILLYAVYGIFFEVPVLFGSEKGFGAFCDVIIIYGAVFCYIPVLPICLVWQIAYLLWKKIPRLGNMSGKKFFIGIGIILLVIIGIAAFPTVKFYVKSFAEKKAAQKMYSCCDEKINYNTNVIHCDGVMGIAEQQYNCIMFDHGRHRVGIIAGDYPEYHEIKLNDAAENSAEVGRIKSEYTVQREIKLKNGRFVTFCPDEKNSHRTTAMLLEYDDGSVYYASELREKKTGYVLYLGLDR